MLVVALLLLVYISASYFCLSLNTSVVVFSSLIAGSILLEDYNKHPAYFAKPIWRTLPLSNSVAKTIKLRPLHKHLKPKISVSNPNI